MVKLYNISIDDFVSACPDYVIIPDLNADIEYTNGYTFIVFSDKHDELRLIISDKIGDNHNKLKLNCALNNIVMKNIVEGRFFINGNDVILTVWNNISSTEMKILKLLFRRNDPSYDISNWIFASEFNDKIAFYCTVNEFISMGISFDWTETDLKKIENEANKYDKLQYSVKSTNGLGFSDRDYMRHYIYQEGKEHIMERTNKDYDILYRGGISKDYDCLWLTTSKDYAEEYGEVYVFEVPLSVLDKLACEEDAMDYLIDEEYRGADPWTTPEFFLYDRKLFDINRMKEDGYTGYYYHEDEYKCVNVCLFREFKHRLIKNPQI